MKRLIALVALTVVGGAAFSQDGGAAAAFREYVAAAKVFDAQRMAAMMHPEALRRFRETFDKAFVGENAERARAELLPLFQAASYEEFAALTDVEAFERLNLVIAAAIPDAIELMKNSTWEVVGQVERGDEVYLTYVMTLPINGQEVRQEVVQRLKQHDGQWRLLLPADSEATIAGIEARY